VRKNKQSGEDNGVNVLIVDDEIGIIDSLSIFLKRYGYRFVRSYRSIRSNRKDKK
jgi:DNA-binding NtrC family response regulator